MLQAAKSHQSRRLANPRENHGLNGSITAFLKTEAGGGVLLALAAILALVVANSPLGQMYFETLARPLAVDIGVWHAKMTLKEWVKDGLMAIFFFVIGLELKREMTVGELSDVGRMALPVAAALGGAVVPAATYLAIAGEADMRGWPVPVATDIAFALAAFAVLAPAANPRLRIFLLTLAVVDDLIAIALIAILFTKGVAMLPLLSALGLLAAVLLIQRYWEFPAWTYCAVGLVAWGLAIQSGVHSSVMAVAAAFIVPLLGSKSGRAILEKLEHAIHPVSAFVILPIFAFAAAGISFHGLGLDALFVPVSAGIALGLALGKPVGIVAAVWCARWIIGTRSSPRLGDLLGLSCLCGIGFTMSLFIGALAYAGDPASEVQMRIGVLAGSVLSLMAGAACFAARRRGSD
jgi:NhaA family Na+:H+ antiporter